MREQATLLLQLGLKETDLTHAELAEVAQVSRNFIGQWFRGKPSDCTTKTIQVLTVLGHIRPKK